MATTDSGNMPVLMVLGDFQFSLNTLVYQEWQRSTEWKWPSQDRFGQLDALQFTGLGPETLQLPGVLYPNWKGDINSVDELRGMGDDGAPLQLIDSLGYVLGRWVIEKIDEKQTQHDSSGKPRKIEFVLALRKYDNGEPPNNGASILDQASSATGGALSAAASAASGATSGAMSGFSSMVNSIKSTASSALGSLKAAADQVKTAVGPVMAEAQSVIGAVNRSIDTVNDLRSTVADVEAQVKSIGSVAAAVGGAKTLYDKIGRLGMGAASATRVVENVSLMGSGMGHSVTSALSNAHAATSGVTSLLSSASSKASSLISSLTS